jgi:signal transduction histidine kinase/ActR/RegA family two-component response regulator
MNSDARRKTGKTETYPESTFGTYGEKLIRARKETLENLKENMDTLKNEIRKTEQLRAQFLSNVSHEIKTPLNSILSATLLLQNKKLDADSKELVDTIHQSGQYLFSLLNDVLDYYKMAANQLSLDHLHFNVQNELKEEVDVFRKKAKLKGIALYEDFSKELPEILTGDATRLKQILGNLLDNAVKFTPPGGAIKVSAEPVSYRNGKYTLRLSVQDTGIGIRKEEQDEIWEKFSMADMSLSRKNGGTGLGLSLSRELCHLLGGKMQMESTPGEGSTFSFTVVMDKGPEKDTESPAKGILNILLVEDNLINQKLTQKILANQGFHVDVADNGKMAVEKFAKQHYDLIFMDIQMPEMDGLEATRQIRQLEKKNGHAEKVKIIALTANSQKEDKERCLAAGMDDYINKPFNIKKFPLILNHYR